MNRLMKRENPMMPRNGWEFPGEGFMDAMLDHFGSLAPEFFGRSPLESRLNVQVLGKEVIAKLPCPGCCKDDIKAEIVGDYLTVHVRQCEKCAPKEDRHYICRERSFSEFEESTRLPVSVNGSGAKAKYNDGVLTLTIPRNLGERNGSRTIPVK